MAIRDRATIRLVDGKELTVEATRQGGTVTLETEKESGTPWVVATELNGGRKPIRTAKAQLQSVASTLLETDRPPERKTSAGAGRGSRKPKGEPVEA